MTVININRFRDTKGKAVSIPFGERVANARKNQGLSQEQLGNATGYSQSIVSRQETGRLTFSPGDAARVARALNNPRLLEHYCLECPAARTYKKMMLTRPKPAA